MAENDSQEKTEQPSLKKLKEAKEKGQVARSKDFNATFILIFSCVALYVLGRGLVNDFSFLMKEAFIFDSSLLTTPVTGFYRLFNIVKQGLYAIAPMLIIIMFLSIAAPLLIGGWVFSMQSLQPKFSRMNPIQGIKRIVSIKGLVEMLKAILKLILVAVISVLVLKMELPDLLVLRTYALQPALNEGMYIILKSILFISASLIVIAAIDAPFQIFQHRKELKMTKQELKDEYKETEGKPEVKSQIRRKQQEISRRRMMAEVPKANVIITNPTHYAVAIAYQQNGERAPRVVAKGKDLIALQINQIAKAHKVPILSTPPLARALYYSTDLEKEIPHGLYVAVAQVLAYIFQLNDRENYDSKPAILQNLPIPDDLKRDV
ncbi:MAG: flagellar biosynthesis protein FlhB [Proteobacteria bacterium]|nr:flagellar biosynthesis protein FlhB [Pseudomonadota bacterium]